MSLQTLGQAQQRNRHVTRSKALQYVHFWREKAIGAVEGMVEAMEVNARTVPAPRIRDGAGLNACLIYIFISIFNLAPSLIRGAA